MACRCVEQVEADPAQDILQKVPIVGSFFVHEVPPEDNPF